MVSMWGRYEPLVQIAGTAGKRRVCIDARCIHVSESIATSYRPEFTSLSSAELRDKLLSAASTARLNCSACFQQSSVLSGLRL